MVSLIISQNLIIISANREIILFDKSQTLSSKFILDAVPVPDKAAKEIIGDHEDSTDIPQQISCIQNMCLSANGKYLAITTIVDKSLYLFELLDNNNIKLLSKRILCRTSSAIRFSSDSNILLVADKTGDCYSFDCKEVYQPGKWLLGHLSMILDIQFTNDKRFIITCDRDEKIRLTKYPDTHIIESYCLGHTEYIGAIEFLPTHPNDILISISGDKHLKLWQLSNGNELFDYELPESALKFAVRKFADNCNHVAITFLHSFKIIIYEIVHALNTFSCNVICNRIIDDTKSFSNIQYDCSNGDLWLASINASSDTISLYKFLSNNIEDPYKIETANQCNEILQTNFKTIYSNMEISSILFKKKFDNVEDYQKRKKQRIEIKIKNNCR